MANKINTTLRIDPDLKTRAEKIAKYEHRYFANYVEKLILQDVNRYLASGFDFEAEIENVPVAVPDRLNKGIDESLVAEFNKLTGSSV
jgi:hypothetical protein